MLKEDDKRRPPEIKGNVHGRWKDTPKQDKTMLNGYICYMLGKVFLVGYLLLGQKQSQRQA